jgi:hypothetical protein
MKRSFTANVRAISVNGSRYHIEFEDGCECEIQLKEAKTAQIVPTTVRRRRHAWEAWFGSM